MVMIFRLDFFFSYTTVLVSFTSPGTKKQKDLISKLLLWKPLYQAYRNLMLCMQIHGSNRMTGIAGVLRLVLKDLRIVLK